MEGDVRISGANSSPLQVTGLPGETIIPALDYVLACILGTVGLSTFLINSFIVVVFARYRSVRNHGNILIINLVVCDMLMVSLGIPSVVISLFIGRDPLGDIGCKLHGFIVGTTGFLSINIFVAVAVERYYVIVLPLKAFKQALKKQIWLCAAFCWILAVGFMIGPLVGWCQIAPEIEGSCSMDYRTRTPSCSSYILTIFTCGFVIPVLVASVSYTRLVQHMVHHESFMTGSKSSSITRHDIRFAKLSIALMVTFIAAWTPYAIVVLIGQFGDQTLLTRYVRFLPSFFAKINTLLNSVIYITMQTKFRRYMRRMLPFASGTSRSISEISRSDSDKRRGPSTLIVNGVRPEVSFNRLEADRTVYVSLTRQMSNRSDSSGGNNRGRKLEYTRDIFLKCG
ncbi:rhodopsin-like [Tubulanus polymorphus]|uniref:rhodopsin-like n=1 Tax=Tubulanus polymorphus TaxID=672921 RepID=UPI003DA32C39